MKFTSCLCALLISTIVAAPTVADLLPYSQDFERLAAAQNVIPNTLSNDGWLVGANVFTGSGAYLYGYFAFPAPNGGPAFSGVVTGEGNRQLQGFKQLSVYSDYNNGDHANADRRIEANVFRDIGLVTAADVGKRLLFSFDAKQGNLIAPSTATAFLKVLDPSNGFSLTAISSLDTTAIGTNWSNNTLSLSVDSSWIGNLVQIGFSNTAGGYTSSGMIYDNLKFTYKGAKDIRPIAKTGGITAVPEPGTLSFLGLGSLLLASCRRRTSR